MIEELEGDDNGTSPDDLTAIIRGVSALALTFLERLRSLTAERTAENLPGKSLPPVLSVELADMSHADFISGAAPHMTPFENLCGSGSVDEVSLSAVNCGGWRELGVESLNFVKRLR